MFVPLSHPPGHAQADFGAADAIIAGVKSRAHFFVMTLPHSDACFVAAYPAAAAEAWLDGHNRAFVFFGGVAPIDSLRQRQVSGVAHLVRWHAATNAGVQRAAVPLPLRGPATAVPARVDPSRKSGGALHRLHCFCLEFDGACEVQRRVPTDWIIEPVDVSGYGSFSLAS